MSEPKELLIMPPDDLIAEWVKEWKLSSTSIDGASLQRFMVAKAAQWGADQELEACCDWLEDVVCDDPQDTARKLRAARRPDETGLKQQALEALNQADNGLNESEWQQRSDTIRRALEALPNE